jgi:hypothetical protein
MKISGDLRLIFDFRFADAAWGPLRCRCKDMKISGDLRLIFDFRFADAACNLISPKSRRGKDAASPTLARSRWVLPRHAAWQSSGKYLFHGDSSVPVLACCHLGFRILRSFLVPV